MIHWAWQQGVDGKDYRATADLAKSGGHYAHSLIECRIKKDNDTLATLSSKYEPEARQLGNSGFDAYLAWEAQTKLEVKFSEVTLCHEFHQYGGTLDAIGYLGNKLCLLDWKCANSTYLEHVIQLAAYWKMWESQNPNYAIEEWHLLRIGKEHADFHHHSYTKSIMVKAWHMFTHMKTLYDLDKELKNVAS